MREVVRRGAVRMEETREPEQVRERLAAFMHLTIHV